VCVRHSVQQGTKGPHADVSALFRPSFLQALLLVVSILLAIVFSSFLLCPPNFTQHGGHKPLYQLGRGQDVRGQRFTLGQNPVGKQMDARGGRGIETLG